MSEVLHGQGATEERKRHSKIKTGIRTMTRGGMVTTYGHSDEEHCLLDWMLNQGVIEQHQYDAGYMLRNLYFMFNKSGTSCLTEKDNAYEGDHETESDRAQTRYNNAMKAMHLQDRPLMKFICIEAEPHQNGGIFSLALTIQDNLEHLKKHFIGARK